MEFHHTIPRGDARLTDIRVEQVGRMPRKQAFLRQRFGILAFGVVVAGSGRYRAGLSDEHIVSPGSLFCVWPGVDFAYGPTGTWDEIYVVLSGTRTRVWAEAGMLPMDGTVRRVPDLQRAAGLYTVLSSLPADQAAHHVEGFLIEVADHHGQAVAPGGAGFMAYCRDHVDTPLSLPQLAERFGMSYSLLRQQVRKRTGVGPATWLRRLRCDVARNRLAATDDAVGEIAMAVGMSDTFTFSKAFKREVGMSPTAYRVQARSMG